MKLYNVELIPGVIINVDDDKQLGRVKCAAPGLFDPDVMPEETLPWVYPISMSGYQHFSKPVKGSKIWIIKNQSSYNEYWYISFFEFGSYAKEYLKNNYNNDPEILLMRDSGPNNVYITYDNNNGYKININESSYLNINNDKIELKNNNGIVKISGDSVSIGKSDESFEPSILGNKLLDLLNNLSKEFNTLSTNASNNIYVTNLAPILSNISVLLSKGDELLAKNSKVN